MAPNVGAMSIGSAASFARADAGAAVEAVGGIAGADVVINLAGRSVNCRYHAANRREMLASRVESTRVVGEAIARAAHPPAVWLQAGTATIYAHRYDAPNDEATGIIGGNEPDALEKWRFSIEVAKAWEQAVADARPGPVPALAREASWCWAFVGRRSIGTLMSMSDTLPDDTLVLDLTPSDDNPRNSEGAFVTLRDGSILFAWTRFTGGRKDDAPADIAARISTDMGRTWSSEDRVIVPNEGQINTMSVSLLRLRDGRIMMMYLVKDPNHDCRPRVRFSEDEARTWSAPICPIATPGYYVVNNDRVIQLSSGRLIFGAAYHRLYADTRPRQVDSRCIAIYMLSDDGGQTWREARDWQALPVPSDSGLQEPGVVELSDGRIFSWCRTTTGCQWGLYSADRGETWTLPHPTEFKSPLSPMSIKRIPKSGHLLAIWNDHSGRFPVPPPKPNAHNRTPLVSAISTDDGATWRHHRLLENDADRGFCYTAIHFTEDDHVLLSYCAGGKAYGGWVLSRTVVRRVPLGWFYQ